MLIVLRTLISLIYFLTILALIYLSPLVFIYSLLSLGFSFLTVLTSLSLRVLRFSALPSSEAEIEERYFK